MDKKVTTQQWEDAIRRARQYVSNYDQVRFKIADIAMEVCDMTHGGRKVEGTYTVSKFAKQIGMDRKTLYEWIRIKRNVLDKLPKTISDHPQKFKYDDFRETVLRVTPESTKEEVREEFYKATNREPGLVKFMKYKKILSSLLYNAQRPILLRDVPEAMLLDYIHQLEKITFLIKEEIKLRARFKTNDAADRARLKMKGIKNG